MNLMRAARVLATSILLLFFCAISRLALPTPRPEELDYFPPKNFLPQTPRKIAEVRKIFYRDLIGSPNAELPPHILKIVKQGFSINSRFDDRDENTPLTHAASFGQLGAVELFLKLKADVNQADNQGRTALWQAAQTSLLHENEGHAPNETAALQKISDRNMAIYLKVIRALLKGGAQTEIEDKNGATALDAPAFYGRIEIVKVLLQAGANSNHRDQFGKTPLEWASYNGFPEVVKLMQRYGGASTPLRAEKQKKLDFALMEACHRKDFAAMKKLVEKGADVNAHVAFWSPLPEARIDPLEFDAVDFPTPLIISNQSPAVTQLLLELGANANGHNGSRETPLMQADIKVTELLLAKGADVNARDDDRQTPLINAARANDAAKVRLFLKRGAQTEVRNKRGETALMQTENKTVLQILLDSGANINARNNEGRTALSKAAFIETGEGGAYIVCDEKLAKSLLKLGANPNIPDNDGNTILMLIAIQGEDGYGKGNPIALAQYLLQHGARLDLKDKDGKTALQLATRFHSKSLARLFRGWK